MSIHFGISENDTYCSANVKDYMGIEKDPQSNGLSRYDRLGNTDNKAVDNEYEDVQFKKY